MKELLLDGHDRLKVAVVGFKWVIKSRCFPGRAIGRLPRACLWLWRQLARRDGGKLFAARTAQGSSVI